MAKKSDLKASYRTKGDLADPLMVVLTAGASLTTLNNDVVCEVEDPETGETASGEGSDRESAFDAAKSKLGR